MTEANVAVDGVQIVTDFLEALAESDSARALAHLDPDVEWRNKGLPTLRGKRVFQTLKGLDRPSVGFGVEIDAIAGEGDTVLTDRKDYLWVGPVKTGFWVRGTFTLRNGLITVWDDAFSMGSFLKGFVTR